MDGKYKLDEMITRRVGLEELNGAFAAMVAGEVKRSVVVYR
jgi:Zn-dependent alcohol dehydrogenase